jgi:hypothetical protein
MITNGFTMHLKAGAILVESIAPELGMTMKFNETKAK